MEAMLQGNDAEPLLVLVTSVLEGAFDSAVGRLRTAVGEENSHEIAACKFSKPLRQHQRDPAVVAPGDLQEAPGLLAQRGNDLGVTVAYRSDARARFEIDVAAPIGIFDLGALAFYQRRRSVLIPDEILVQLVIGEVAGILHKFLPPPVRRVSSKRALQRAREAAVHVQESSGNE